MEFSGPRTGPLSGIFIFRNIFLLIAFSSFLNEKASGDNKIRVLVEKNTNTVLVEGFDVRVLRDGRIFKTKSGKAEIRLVCSDLPYSSRYHISSQGGFLRIGHRQFRDDLVVQSDKKGQCVVINDLDLEKYVAGVLNSEMSSKWSYETLKAQAVAARTYAIYQRDEARKKNGNTIGADLESTVSDQVYEGAHQEKYRAIQSVKATEGLILTSEGRPIKAFYHSTCGGFTESPEKVWGKRFPYLKGVTCGFCERSPRYQWNFTLSLSALSLKLRKKGIIPGEIAAIHIAERNKLGRASKIEIIYEKARSLLVDDKNILNSKNSTLSSGIQKKSQPFFEKMYVRATTLRDALGTDLIRSTDFHIAQAGQWLAFAGHGSGHGVGLCQWGAKFMGDRGFTYIQILKKYYPLAEIRHF